MIEKETLLKKIYKELPYLKRNLLLASRIDLLYELYSVEKSFYELINNLYTSDSRNIESFLAEINIIYDIVQTSPELKPMIKYESESGKGNPDLKIELENSIIWIQIKCFSIGLLDKRRNVSIKLLTEKLSKNFDYSFDIETSYELNLSDDEIEVILQCISRKDKCLYEKNGNIVNIKRNDRTDNFVLSAGIIPTNIYKEQIRKSFVKAEKSLPVNNQNTINIIICENANDRQDNIDVADVLFGQEYQSYYGNGNHSWGRKNNGLLHNKNNRINYYCIYETPNRIIEDCIKRIFVLEENNNLDIYDILGIDEDHKITKYDFISGN